MGVLRLTTFIKEHETNFFLDFKLQNTKLIIDGSNLLYFLQNHYEEESVYGGNYDHLFKRYIEFFKTLLKCNVTPVVVFDGADDPDNTKLDTILKRLDDQFEKVKKWEKMEGLLPVLSKITLCQVLVDLNIAHISCIYEADREIAVLANKWNCPVVSNDSDFYVYSLHGGSISMACLVETARRDTAGKYYVPAKLYQFNIVLKELFKMENDEYMFPVFATLVGNDYFDPSYMTLECPKNPTNKLRCVKGEIDPVVEWMRRSEFTSGRTALEQISRQIPDNKREQFETSVNLYLKIDKFSSFDLEACLLTKYSGNNALLSDNDTKAYKCEVLNKQNHAEESRTEHCTKAIHRLAANCSSIKSYTADNHQVVEIGNSSGHFARTEHREEILYDRKLQNDITKQCLTEDIQAQSKDGTSNQSKTADHLGSFEDKGTENYKVIYRRESLGNNGVIQSVDKSISSTCISEHQESLDDIHRLNATSNQLEQLEDKDESADVSKEPENIILRDRNKHQLPSWFVRHAIECNMDCSFILNIAQNHRLIFKPQPEMYKMTSSFKCSERVRRVIYRLVLTHKKNFKSEQRRGEIEEYHRNSSKRSQVKPINILEGISELPCLEIIPKVSESERKAIVFATFGASLASFDDNMDASSQLLILMLSLWMENSYVPECHLNALIIGMIALHIFSPTRQGHRQCPDILEAIGDTDKEKTRIFRKRMETHLCKQIYLVRRGINKKFVHNVSRFQAVYLHTYHLNQLLLSPVCIPSPSVILNSTFTYNMCHLLENNVEPKNILCGEKSPLYLLFTEWKKEVEKRYTGISPGRYGILYGHGKKPLS